MAQSSLTATQGIGTNVAFRNVDTSGTYAQAVDFAPWVETPFTGSQTLTVGTSSVGTTGSASTITIPSGATHAYISVEGAGIRFWNTGDTPTAGTAGSGHALTTGAGPLEVNNLGSLRMVTGGTSSGTVQISYHKYS